MIPALQRHIVVGSRINHTVLRIAVRQITAGALIIKSKLQHLHARESSLLHQLQHRRSQESKILRNDRKLAKLLLHCLKEAIARSLLPVAKLRSLVLCRNRIVGIKSTEMIHPHHIIQAEAVLHPRKPPGITGLLMALPAVERIAPQLTRCRKRIRRTSSYRLRLTLRIKLEQFRMRPAVRAVHGHINRNIPDDLHAVLIGVML